MVVYRTSYDKLLQICDQVDLRMMANTDNPALGRAYHAQQAVEKILKAYIDYRGEVVSYHA